jgi:hypothetical protein
MKNTLVVGLVTLTLLFSCKEQQKPVVEEVETPDKELSIPEQIADANGFANWKNVNKITFSFNVDRDSSHFERTWSWAPKSNDVIFTTRDKNSYTYEHQTSAMAPMSQTAMQKLTIVYGNEGGYTPGDAYDFYFEDDFVIKEWAFRKGNQAEPNMVTSWEDYKKFNGLNIASMHKRLDGNFKLYFTGIMVD